MTDLFMWLIGIIVSIVATLLVSKHYYTRTFVKSLTPFIQFSSSPLEDIDPQVREDLQISYKNKEIANLYEIQFLIANTGDKAIHNVFEPLTLKISGDHKLLDVSIIYVSPEGRKIEKQVHHDKNQIEYIFPLLNSGEFFITKLLINGNAKIKDFSFTIVADELPPCLVLKYLPYDAVSTPNERKFERGLLALGLLFTLLGVSISKLIYDSWGALPSITDYGIRFVFHLGFSGWGLLLSIVPAFMLLLIGVMMSIGSFNNFQFPPPKNKFVLPDNQRIKRRDSLPFEYPINDK